MPSRLFVVPVVLLAAIFAADLSTRPGIAWGMAYSLVVLLAFRVHRRYEIQLLAAAATALIVTGFVLGIRGAPLAITLPNRALSVIVVWSVAWVGIASHRTRTAALVSEERLRAVFDTAVDAIVLIDSRGIITACNGATERLFGWTHRELVGRNVSVLMPSPDREAHDDYIERYLSTGERRIIGIGREVTALRRDGSRFPIDLSVSEFRIGGEVSFAGLVRDSTDRKESAAALARSNRALEDRNRELQNIVYVTSHDLRSPLVNIQGFGQELKRSCARLSELALVPARSPDQERELRHIVDEEIPEALHFVLGSATKMDGLLAGLLRLSRLGRAALRVEALDMNALVREVATAMEFQIQRAGARLTVGELPPCRGDATQVGQVFSNLLDNALKYAQPGRPPEITISGEKNDTAATYRIRDNGIGIAAAHQARVFEVFHRLDAARGEGEGLGLAIAQRILERHDGSITVESEPGRGCTFIVTLPCA
jgi:PAS domain S-box-containing protein